ncbi:hypothetical protein ACS0TY_014886 [Phlomoides rotata]
MKKLLPSTDIVANPHINSKIHVWKKDYSALSDLLSKSGIDWNSTSSMIEVEDKVVYNASRRPYYAQWIDIFGKDRATGENDVDPMNLVNDLMCNGAEQE